MLTTAVSFRHFQGGGLKKERSKQAPMRTSFRLTLTAKLVQKSLPEEKCGHAVERLRPIQCASGKIPVPERVGVKPCIVPVLPSVEPHRPNRQDFVFLHPDSKVPIYLIWEGDYCSIGRRCGIRRAGVAVVRPLSGWRTTCSEAAMPRLHQRNDRSGYFVTNSFSSHGRVLHTTYQASNRAVDTLAAERVRSGDEFSKQLFFQLLEEGELTTDRTGPGEEIARGDVRPQRGGDVQRRDRRQIPQPLSAELLNEDNSFISFAAFKTRYGGTDGYSDTILRAAYRELEKEYRTGLPQQLSGILKTHHPIEIKRTESSVFVELVASS